MNVNSEIGSSHLHSSSPLESSAKRQRDERMNHEFAVCQQQDDSMMVDMGNHLNKKARYAEPMSPGVVSLSTTTSDMIMSGEKAKKQQGTNLVEWWKQKPRNTQKKVAASDECICFVCQRAYSPEKVDLDDGKMPANALLNYFAPKRGPVQTKCPAASVQTKVSQKDLCTFCERTACPNCMRHCEDCQHRFCTFCSTMCLTSGRLERILCLDCANGYHHPATEGDAMQTD